MKYDFLIINSINKKLRMTYVLCCIENLVKVIFIDIIIVQNQILNFEL